MKEKYKYKLVLLLLVAFVPALTVSGLYAYSEDIELGGKKDRGAVDFPHELHMDGFECLDCHHVMENGENVLDEGDLEEDNPDIYCGACHKEGATLERKEAFHYQCMGCHNNYKMTNEKTGPLLCGECHVLKK